MRTFTLGEKYAAIPKTPENYASGITVVAFGEYKQELRDAIGVDHIGGHPPHRIAEKDGFFFEWTFDGPWIHISKTPVHPDGQVMCECENMSFHILYGSYECFGRCIKCSKEWSIYSG